MSQREELQIERLGQLGDGIALHVGRAVFVRGALPGERVLVELEPEGKVLRGRLLEILEASPDRREPRCPLFDRCGGCDWLHASASLQRESKREIVLSALEHNARISRDAIEVRPLSPSSEAMGYRRRAVLHWQGGALGFYGHRTHDFVVVDHCPALVPELAALPGLLSPLLAPIAKEVASVDLLSEGGHVAFAVYLHGGVKPKISETIERALRELRLRGAVLVPHEGAPTLLGKPVLRSISPLHPEVPLYLRPDGFAQANAEGNVALVTSALNELGPRDGDRVLELYSGNGNFTFALAAIAREVVAVESSKIGVGLAQRSVQEARLANVKLVEGDSRKVAEGLAKEGQRFDLLLADPPRTGAPGIAQWASRLGVRRVVYVACDPASLARDGAALQAAGYTPRALQIIDLFPQTRHVEAVMSFERAAGRVGDGEGEGEDLVEALSED